MTADTLIFIASLVILSVAVALLSGFTYFHYKKSELLKHRHVDGARLLGRLVESLERVTDTVDRRQQECKHMVDIAREELFTGHFDPNTIIVVQSLAESVVFSKMENYVNRSRNVVKSTQPDERLVCSLLADRNDVLVASLQLLSQLRLMVTLLRKWNHKPVGVEINA